MQCVQMLNRYVIHQTPTEYFMSVILKLKKKNASTLTLSWILK